MASAALRRYPADVARAFSRAPVEMACAVLVAAGFSWAIELQHPQSFQAWWYLVMVVVLAGGAAWAGTLLHALGDWSEARRWAVTGGGALLAVAFGVFFLDMDREAEVWRGAVLIVTGVLMLAAAPALGHRGGAVEGKGRGWALRRFRRVNARILLRCVGSALYSGALFAGLALALQAVDSLFDLQMDGEIYGHVLGWIAFAIAPWIVMGGLPDFVRPLDEESDTMALVHRVLAWLVLPLLALYYVILYAYAVRILLLEELPRNLVSPLVMAAGVLAAAGLILFDRAHGVEGPVGRPAVRALRLTPLLFLPLAALGVWALMVRVNQYGWTEFRYMRMAALVALAAAALGAAVLVLRRRTLPLHLAPVVPAVIFGLSAVGPWSATALSERSQRARLFQGLEEAGVLRDGVVVADTAAGSRTVDADVYATIASTSHYLVSHFGPEAVTPPLPPNVVSDGREARDVPTILGLVSIAPRGLRVGRGAALPQGGVVEANGTRLVRVQLIGRDPARARGGVRQDSLRVVVRAGTDVLTADLEPVVRWLLLQPEGYPTELPPERARVPLLDRDGVQAGVLVIFDLDVEGGEAPQPIARLEGVALVGPR